MSKKKSKTKLPNGVDVAKLHDNTLFKQVENVLAANKECRTNDLLLYAKLLNRYYDVDVADDRLMLDLTVVSHYGYPSMESVSRTRRYFQSVGWFLPSTKREDFIKNKRVIRGKKSKLAEKRLSTAATPRAAHNR